MLLLLFLLLLLLLHLLFPSLVPFGLGFATGSTLGGTALEAKGCPGSEILAPLAPFDLIALEGSRFGTFVNDDPNLRIASGADALVLGGNGGNDVGSILLATGDFDAIVAAAEHLVVASVGFGFEGPFQTAHFALVLGDVGIVGQHHEFGEVQLRSLFHVALKVRRWGTLKRDTSLHEHYNMW